MSALLKPLLFLITLCITIFLPGLSHAETVTLQLKWTHQFQFAGYYAAIEKGFYREEGLTVLLKEGYPGINPVQEVVDGHAAFGVDNTSLLVARDRGAPIRVIAAIFQHSPQVLISRQDAGILSPHDLKHKRIMLVPEQSTDILAMLTNEGIDFNQVTLLSHNWDMAAFNSGKADAITGYSTAELFSLQQQGLPIHVINPINYGIDYYGDCLFTTDTTIQADPDLVKRFTRASLKGWEYAMSHQEEMIGLILAKYNSSLSPERLRFEANEMNKIILPDYVEPGHMNPDRWAKIVEIHQRFGLLKPGFSLENFLYNVNDTDGSAGYRTVILPLFVIIGLLSLALLAFMFFNSKLKRIVKERTEILEKKVHELQETEKAVLHLAYHDTLTKLPNRLQLIDHIDTRKHREDQLGEQFAIAFFDLDDFKRINDGMGHSTGDAFLREVSLRLQRCLKGIGQVYRLGGDEFILLLPQVQDYNHIAGIIQAAIEAINSSWNFNGNDLHVSASAGIAMYPKDGQDADSLIKAADMAMYEAKQKGKNRYHFFDEEMHAACLDKLILEAELHQAISQQEFVLHYQPQITSDAHIIGVEALVRWQHPSRGLLYPGTFIPLAEETGLIVPIGDWVLDAACRQCADWQRGGQVPVRISVNISVKQLQHPSFLAKVRHVLDETGLSPEYLELEITETVALTHADLVLPIMNSLRAMGVRLALDDFGIGYSSLMYLRSFPIDVLKIDKTFIQDVPTNIDNEAILQTILELARHLRISAVAEGVETLDQFNCLKKYACPIVQGYLFSPPMPAEDLSAFFATLENR